MVEFALVLPLLLLLMLGVIEVGRLLFTYSMVYSAVRESVRYGSASGDVGGFVAHYEDCNGIRDAAKRIGGLAGVNDSNITIQYDHGPGGGGAFSTSCPPTQSVELGDRILVEITTHYQPVVPIVNIPPIPISSSSARTIFKDITLQGTPLPAYP